MKDTEQLNHSQKNQGRWLDTWMRLSILPPVRRKNMTPHVNTSQLKCCRPTLGSRGFEKRVMKDTEQLDHSQKNQSRWLGT